MTEPKTAPDGRQYRMSPRRHSFLRDDESYLLDRAMWLEYRRSTGDRWEEVEDAMFTDMDHATLAHVAEVMREAEGGEPNTPHHDGTHCSVCTAECDEPHTWQDCAVILAGSCRAQDEAGELIYTDKNGKGVLRELAQKEGE